MIKHRSIDIASKGTRFDSVFFIFICFRWNNIFVEKNRLTTREVSTRLVTVKTIFTQGTTFLNGISLSIEQAHEGVSAPACAAMSPLVVAKLHQVSF